MTLRNVDWIVRGLMFVVAVGILVSIGGDHVYGLVPLCWAMFGLAVASVALSFAIRAQDRRTASEDPDRERLR